MRGARLFQTIQTKLIIIYVLLILIAMQLIGVYFIRALESHFLSNFSVSLTNQTYLIAKYAEPYLSVSQDENKLQEKEKYEGLDDVVKNLNTISKAEIQVIDANGVVVSSSLQFGQSVVGQKNTQTEVSRALQGIRINERTMIDSNGVRNKVIAMPVGERGKVEGAIYMVASMEDTYATINRINRIFFTGTLIALALTALLGVILSNTITKPIKEITKRAKEMAEGNLNRQVKVIGSDEIGQLGQTFNYMTERLREALSQNEEEKEKLASILSNMSDGVIATDESGRVILMNRSAQQMLQIQEKDAVQKDMLELLGMKEDELIGELMDSEENSILMELNIPGQDDVLQVKVTFTRIQRRGQGITGTIAVLQDVTEQEKLERARKEFVANVSHELRTPLTTIKSYLEALGDGAIDEPQLAHRFVGVTRNETERMIRLVTDLLHLSRLDSKQAILAKEPTYIEAMLEDVADRFSFQLQQRSIDIAIDVERDIPPVMIDSDQIDQVLDNLVSNSIKYTGDHGVIELKARRFDNGWLEVSVKDTGIGIPKKDLERIFERFYRVDKARSRNMGGTGLGLSIAREIVKAHGGTILLESDMNQGTKVSFYLPMLNEESEAL